MTATPDNSNAPQTLGTQITWIVIGHRDGKTYHLQDSGWPRCTLLTEPWRTGGFGHRVWRKDTRDGPWDEITTGLTGMFTTASEAHIAALAVGQDAGTA